MPACGTGSARPRRRASGWRSSPSNPARPTAIRRSRKRRRLPPRRTKKPRKSRRPTPRNDAAMSVIASIRGQLVPIHREGYPFIAVFALAALLLFLAWPPLGTIGVLATLWVVYFFRDPPRVTPLAEGLVVAPADGRISLITRAVPPAELALGAAPLPRVSIFMSVFDCHVNRSPVSGRIERMVYRAGKFLNAGL